MQISEEFVGAVLGDRRLGKRLQRVIKRMAPSPSKSFPARVSRGRRAGGDVSLSQSRRGDAGAHSRAAPGQDGAARSRREDDSGGARHDPEARYSSEREGLGRVSNKGTGYFAHFSFAVGAKDGRPLGTLGLKTFARGEQTRAKRRRGSAESRAKRIVGGSRSSPVEEALDEAAQAIHVMDREAD